MKKPIEITIILIISILLLGSIFSVVDYLRAKNDKKPLFAFGTTSHDDGGSKNYYGFGYKVIKCNTLSGDTSVHFGFYNISVNKLCNSDIIQEEFSVVDETEICADALELIYEDDNYNYYFPCIKSGTVFIVFPNGSKMTVSDALEQNKEEWGKLLVEKSPEMFYKNEK